ncbi:MAG: hypothetical protein ACK5W1_02545 [Flavobacteriales bacterium]
MNRFYCLLFDALFLCLPACKKDEDTPPADNSSNNGGGGNSGDGSVYICGRVNSGGFGDNYPRYWKDGEEHVIGDGSRGQAYEIVVNDEHVIIAGAVYDGNATIPCYWVDDEPTELLSYACGECLARDVFVVGDNDVHIAGRAMDEGVFGSNQKAMYLHNGVGVELTDGADPARAHGVHVYNGEVYVCGFEEDGSGGRRLAKYWVNGTEVVLGDDEENSLANDIWVEDGDVYVVGYEDIYYEAIDTYIQRPVLWINGERQLLAGGDTMSEGEATRIFIENDSIYIVGFVELSGLSNLTSSVYWINGEAELTYDVSLAVNGTIGLDIHVLNGEVHTVGLWGGSTGQLGHYSNNTAQTDAFYGDAINGICIH